MSSSGGHLQSSVFPLSSPLPTSHCDKSIFLPDRWIQKQGYISSLRNIHGQQDWMRTLPLFISRYTGHWCFFTFHSTSTILDLVHHSAIYTHSLSFQFSIFFPAYLLAPLYQRVISLSFSRCWYFTISFSPSVCMLHPFPRPTISLNLQILALPPAFPSDTLFWFLFITSSSSILSSALEGLESQRGVNG